MSRCAGIDSSLRIAASSVSPPRQKPDPCHLAVAPTADSTAPTESLFVPNFMLPELDTEAFSPPPPPPPRVGEAWSDTAAESSRALGADAPSPSLAPQPPAHSVTSSASARAREPKHVHLVLSPRLSSQLTRPVSNGAGPDRSCKAAAPAEADGKRAAARAEPMHTGRHGRAAASELSEEEPKRRRTVCCRLAALPPLKGALALPVAHSQPLVPRQL